jgi:hypothetical protein
MNRPHLLSGGRYPVLRALAIIYLFLAGVAVLGGLIGAGWALVRLPLTAGDKVISAAAILVGSFFAVITMLAIAEVLKLVIDIEHNTRISALRALRPTAPGDGPTVPGMDGGRFRELNEETAEAALLKGH